MLDGVVIVCDARPPVMRNQVNVSVEAGLMLRRSGFSHGCVMQDIAGISSGSVRRVLVRCPTSRLCRCRWKRGCHGDEAASMSELELSAAATVNPRRKWREWAPH